MEHKAFIKYQSAMPSLQASETLSLITPSMFPHLKDTRRREIIGKLKTNMRECVKLSKKNFGDVVANMKRQLSGR